MKNINYKIVSIVLAGMLLVTYAWHWENIFSHDDKNENMKMGNMQMSGMGSMNHTMPDGTVMGNDSMMKKDINSSMNMGSMSMDDMSAMMKGKTGKALEKEFLTGMVPHHQGAVEMAKVILADKTTSPEIRTFAENIIKAQDAEIKMMTEWLKKY